MKGEPRQMELSAAEIRQEGAFLHPAQDPKHSFFVKADEVDIIIKPGAEILDSDILIFDNASSSDESVIDLAEEARADQEMPSEYETATPTEPVDVCTSTISDNSGTTHGEFCPRPVSQYMPKKISLTVMLYPDEHDRVTRFLKETGYKKAEYFLACMESAKKTSMNAAYRRYATEHAQRRKTELAEAKRAREADMANSQQLLTN